MRGGRLRPQTSRQVRGRSYQDSYEIQGYLGLRGHRRHRHYRLAVVIIAVINLFPWSYLHGALKVTVGYYLHTHVGKVPT